MSKIGAPSKGDYLGGGGETYKYRFYGKEGEKEAERHLDLL